uniref:G-protein coupled receptors family 1 profile domain-containing protein n=1 Tax=Pelusios castaneus TaxID=367368 RepID=A0A8C8VGJ9_9SAUR
MNVEEVVSVSDTTNFNLTTATTFPCAVNQIFSHRFLSVVYFIVFLLGLLGNGLGLWSLCAGSRRSSWSALRVLVCNLGVADLLYVFTLPFLMTYYHQGRVWSFGKESCRLMRALFHINLYASIGFLTCISIHRYLGIVHPLKIRGRCQALGPNLLLSALVWGWVIIQVSPDFSFSKINSTGTKCHDTTGNENLDAYLPYVLAITMTGFVIPFLIIVGCYGHVVVVLVRNENVNPTLKRRSIKLVVLVMVLFSICFLPYHVFRNLNLLTRKWQLQGACTQTLKNIYVSYQVSRGLASFNSALNPLLYLMTSEDSMSWIRTISQRAGQSLGSLRLRGTQKSITLCEEFKKECDDDL